MKKEENRVYLCECWARDGLQNIEMVVPTAEKIQMINRFSKAGYARIETTSFSNPKRLPQFADAEEILRGIKRNPAVSYKATCINEKALDRCIEAKETGHGPNEVSFMISVSEAHNTFNTKMAHQVHWLQIEEMMKKALQAKLRVIATLGTVYGCPLAGDVSQQEVINFVERYLGMGAEWICLGDTTGAGNPKAVKEMFGELQARYPQVNFIAHFHDTRGTGIANAYAAYETGIRYFDCALGGIGGQPAGSSKYHLGFSGNVCSEDLICMFEEMGIKTGIKQKDVITLGQEAERILDSPLRSNVIRCGPVVHKDLKIG